MRYHNITKDDMLNGSGIRVVLWVAGCKHNCKGCQNPITHNPNGGIIFDEEAINEIYEELDKDYVSGITFSGGDPLHENNINEITLLAKTIKEKYNNKTIWLYTGYKYEEIANLEILKYIDVLCDGKFEIEKRDVNLPWVGSNNQRVIDVKMSRNSDNIVLYGGEK